VSRRLLALAAALAATAPALLLVPACSDEGSTALATESIDLARERAAAHFQKDERGRAREALKPLVERKDAVLEDLVRAAAVELADNQTQAAHRTPSRIRAASRSSPSSDETKLAWAAGSS